MASLTHRTATETDIPALVALMDRAITGPLADFLTPEQIAASRKLMGIDSQIIADRTYVIVESDGVLAGCGGWSGRITEYGEPLYRAAGYAEIERFEDDRGGVPVPLVRMGKRLIPA